MSPSLIVVLHQRFSGIIVLGVTGWRTVLSGIRLVRGRKDTNLLSVPYTAAAHVPAGRARITSVVVRTASTSAVTPERIGAGTSGSEPAWPRAPGAIATSEAGGALLH